MLAICNDAVVEWGNAMVTTEDFFKIAMSLQGTTSAPHFDRTAFKVKRIYATLSPDKTSINLKFLPEEQTLKCLTHPDAFSAVPNAWGKQGWTTARLSALSIPELEAALQMAWRHAIAQNSPQRSRK